MALAPLFQSTEPVAQIVANAARCIKKCANDRIREADLLTVLALFGKLTHPGFDPIDIIGREAMRESPFYEQIQNEIRQSNVIEALEIRFGKVPAREFKNDIYSIHAADDLDELHRASIKLRTLAAFRKVLDPKLKSQPAN